MKILLIWGHKFRPWGYEVRVDLQDNSDHIYNEVLTFPGLLEEETIAKTVKALVLRVKKQLSCPGIRAGPGAHAQGPGGKDRIYVGGFGGVDQGR